MNLNIRIVLFYKITLIIIILRFGDVTAQSDSSANTTTKEISPRLLFPVPFFRPSLFNIVRFPNDECFDASNQSGTCFTSLECKALGGAPSSSCAAGLGTCCIVSKSCHNATSHRVVYFKNPSYPQTDMQQNFCDLTVNIIDPNVCQLRLDFLDFQLDQPFRGDCLGDKLTISASGFSPTSVPTLCGLNRNQHMYVSLPRDMTERSASIVFITDNVGDYRWHMRITQIDCNRNFSKKQLLRRYKRQYNTFSTKITAIKPSLTTGRTLFSLPAPHGCLQYFTNPTGLIESFNFGQYLNNLDYAICIERQPNTCRTIFTASDLDFSIDKSRNIKLYAGVGDVDCSDDYLNIAAGSENGNGRTFDRYCGGKLSYLSENPVSTPVISKANGPVLLRFHSDNTQDPSIVEGFRIRYEQSPTDCNIPIVPIRTTVNTPTPVAANLIRPEYQHERQENTSQGRNNGKLLKF